MAFTELPPTLEASRQVVEKEGTGIDSTFLSSRSEIKDLVDTTGKSIEAVHVASIVSDQETPVAVPHTASKHKSMTLQMSQRLSKSSREPWDPIVSVQNSREYAMKGQVESVPIRNQEFPVDALSIISDEQKLQGRDYILNNCSTQRSRLPGGGPERDYNTLRIRKGAGSLPADSAKAVTLIDMNS